MLWSVVFLALLATGITAAGRSDVLLATNVRHAAAAEAAADGGIAAAVFHVTDASAQAWPADDQPRQIAFAGYTLRLRIADESRKVNPNLATSALLTALLVASGADQTRAASITQAIGQWHAADTHDAVVAQYRAAGMPAAPTGFPFRSLDELGLVMGMTPEILARFRPHLSVFAEGLVDFPAADPVVRQAVLSLGTGAPQPSTVRPTVIDVTADAQSRDGSRFIRHAVVALGADQTGRPFRTLLWEALPAG